MAELGTSKQTKFLEQLSHWIGTIPGFGLTTIYLERMDMDIYPSDDLQMDQQKLWIPRPCGSEMAVTQMAHSKSLLIIVQFLDAG